MYFMEILIRKARLQDYTAVLVLLGEHSKKTSNSEISEKQAFSRKKLPFKKVMETLVQDPSVFLLVALHNEEVVGVLLASMKHVNQSLIPPTRERSFVLIEYINVSQKYRYLGIGRKLMEQVELWAESNSIEKLELEVFEHNSEVVSFYERQGYRQMKRVLFKRVLQNVPLTKDEEHV